MHLLHLVSPKALRCSLANLGVVPEADRRVREGEAVLRRRRQHDVRVCPECRRCVPKKELCFKINVNTCEDRRGWVGRWVGGWGMERPGHRDM